MNALMCLLLVAGSELWQTDPARQDWAILGSQVSLATLKGEGICLLDADNHRVIVIGRSGENLVEFGRKGLGPGEFQAPAAIAVHGDRVAVFDSIRGNVAWFSKAGTYLEDQRLPAGTVSVFQPSVFSDGSLLVTSVRLNAQFLQSYALEFCAPDFSETKTMVERTAPPTDWSRMNDTHVIIEYLVGQFETLAAGIPMGLALAQDMVVVSPDHPFGYRIDANGLETPLKWSCQPRPWSDGDKNEQCRAIADRIAANAPFGSLITDLVIQKAIEQSDLPEVRAPVDAMVPMDAGFALLVVDQQSGVFPDLVFFDVRGNEQSRVDYVGPTTALAIDGDVVYAAGIDEHDEMIVSARSR